MRGHLAAVLLKQRPPALHMIVFDPGEILKDGATLHVALDACERAVQPRRIHLIGVVVVPNGFDRHSSMLSRPSSCVIRRCLRRESLTRRLTRPTAPDRRPR